MSYALGKAFFDVCFEFNNHHYSTDLLRAPVQFL